MKFYPKLLANFWKSAKPFLFSSLDMAEYLEEFIDLEVGIMRGGIFVCVVF